MKRIIHSFLLVLTAMLFSFTSFSQLSPSGQIKIVTPGTLSGCGRDTVFVELTNTKGPTCPAPGAGAGNVTLVIDVPGDTTIKYQASSVGSFPAGASEVSYVPATKKLTMTIPVPSYGSTTRAYFVVNASCKVVELAALPSFIANATYPTGFGTAPETWTSGVMNLGNGVLNVRDNITAPQTTAFNQAYPNDGYVISNAGFGNLYEVNVTLTKSDSLYNYIGGAGSIPWLYRYNSTASGGVGGPNDAITPISVSIASLPNYSATPNGNGTTTYKFTLKNDFFGVDNAFTPGESFYCPSNYFTSPFTCQPDMLQTFSFESVCVGGGPACTAPETFRRDYKVSAGTPILGTAAVVAQAYDGCSPKSISYNFTNTAAAVAGQPAVNTAYNVEYSIPLGNLITISNLKINGVAIPASMIVEDLSKPTSSVTLKIKDFNTLSTIGFTNLDSDGKFDELQPGASFAVTFDYAVPCGLTCGANFLYDIKAVTKYTDFCGKLLGSSSSDIYSFGLEQINAISQVTPLPDLVALYNAANGTSKTVLTTGDLTSATGRFGFNYKSKNINMGSAVAKLRLNYAKDYEIVEPIKFLGVTKLLSDFTAVGTGRVMPTGSTIATPAVNKATDKDSILEYTLSAAEVALLFDGTMDSLVYSMTHITCDSFQSQNNTNFFQIVFDINPACTPGPSCSFDLACKKGFGVKINEGCGTVPCYINSDTLYRKSLVGFTTAAQTTPVTLPMTDEDKFYTGDTLTHVLKSHLSGNYPPYATLGTFAGGFGAIAEQMIIGYDIPGNIPDIHPLTWVSGRVKIVDSAKGGIVVAEFDMNTKDFYAWQGKNNPAVPTTTALGDNLNYPSAGWPGGATLGDYYSINQSWDNIGVYPLDSRRYYSPGSYMYFSMARNDKKRMLDYYKMDWEEAAVRAGYGGLDISSKDLYIFTETNWRVNPDFPHSNILDYDFSTYTYRYGEGSGVWGGNSISRCGINQAVAKIATKEIIVQDAGATYNSTCGLRVDNKLFLKSQAGDYFLNEVRVPYKLDSITVDLPTEYYVATNTAAPSFGYNNGTAQTAAAPTYVGSISVAGTHGTQTGHVKFTGALAGGEFDRMTDAAGKTVTDSLSYYISNVGTDNTINNNYRIPVKYYLREENGTPFVLIDTISIVEGKGALKVSPFGGEIKIADSDDCEEAFMDVIVNNDSIYTAGFALLNAFGTATTQVLRIADVGKYTDPISASDTGTVAANQKYALLGAIPGGAAGQRIVRIFFKTTSCNDSIKVVTNFGCNYPAGNNIYANSTTKDSTFIKFKAITPQILLAPTKTRFDVQTLCEVNTLEFDIVNAKTPNLKNIKFGIKLPPNVKYVPGTAQINGVHVGALPNPFFYANIIPSQIISSGLAGDSLVLQLDSSFIDPNLLNSYGSGPYFYPGCGFMGNGDQFTVYSQNRAVTPGLPTGGGYTQGFNKIKLRLQVEFTACPATSNSPVYAAIKAQSFCGTITENRAVINLNYVGATATANNYSCSTTVAKKIAICAKPGETQLITDTLVVKNEGGFATSGASSGTDSLVITIPIDVAAFTISNVIINGVAVPLQTNAEGKFVLRTLLPAGIPVGGSFNLPISYQLSPLVANACSVTSAGTCPELAFFTEIKSVVSLACAAKGLTCTSLAVVSRGQGMSVRDITCCASLGNKVWLDEGAGGGTAKDGIQNGTEPGVAGVPVNLYQNGTDGLPGTADDVLVASTITDAYGIYLFDNLQPSTGASTQYNVRVTPPSNYSLTTQTNTADDNNTTGASTIGSDVNELGVTYSIDLSAGENNPNIDAGLIFKPATTPNSIGDKVWFDANGDGVNNGGAAEPGVAGVTVTLYDAATGNVVAVTTTDANGNYLFNNLPSNTNYQVGFSAPAGTVLTTGGTLDLNNASTNSDPNPTTGLTSTINSGAPGTQITGVDAGLKNDPKGAIGDFVWNDINNNGIQDAGEPGIQGVTMKLYGPGPDGVVGGGDDILLATTTTDANGYYVFPNLDPAKYFVVATPVAGYTNSAANQGTNDTKDTDFNTGTGAYAGSYVSGTYTLLTTGAGVTRDMTVDLGLHTTTPINTLNTLGDKVWNDLDKDGIQDAGEAGVPNVTVRLLDAAGVAVNNPATGKPYVVSTDANGNYKFVDLPDGNYIVEFANLPAGYSFTGKDATGTGNPGSATDGTTDSDASPSNGRTGLISVDAASASATSVNIVNVDAGISQGLPAGTASLGNRVWYDIDNDGKQDAGELGVNGVKVELLDASGNPVFVPGTSTPYVVYTNALGEYLFTGLPAGSYTVRFSNLPVGYTSSIANAAGIDDAQDADASFAGASNPTTTATTAVYMLAAGEDNLTVDMGIVPPATGNNNSLGNFVWSDLNADGQQDAGEPGVQGVTVTLYNNGPDGLPGTPDDVKLGVTTTDNNGEYSFVGLPDGNYNVTFTNLPAGFTFTPKDAAGTTTADGSDASPLSGRTGTIALDPTGASSTGINNVDADAGIITTRAALGNFVWIDTNGDGIQDPTEKGVSGVTVILYAADGVTVVASTVTDADGKYYFGNLTPGDYVVGFSTLPSNLGFTQQNTPGDNGNNTNSDADPITGKTAVITLVAGETDLTVDAGLKPTNDASVGNFVWNDLNGDGIQNANEPGVPGILVTLYDAATNLPVGTAITDGNGNYLISKIPAAPAGTNYYIIFSNLPTTATFTTQTSNVTPGDATNGSDANGAGQTAVFTLTPGQYLPTVDAGIKNVQLLPIKYESFTATPNGSQVQLEWVVTEQTNVATYEVETSVDGRTFARIATQSAVATTKYNAIHATPIAGVNYYRIKTIEKDGSVSYSVIRTVTFGKSGSITIYPNPATSIDVVKVSLTGTMTGKAAMLSIISMEGKIVSTQRITRTNQTEYVNISNLASGTYVVKIVTENEIVNTKLEVIK
jgi:SdrD B-like domain/Secretion system C-terminal sorting domain